MKRVNQFISFQKRIFERAIRSTVFIKILRTALFSQLLAVKFQHFISLEYNKRIIFKNFIHNPGKKFLANTFDEYGLGDLELN